MHSKRFSVIGCGKLGLCLAACLGRITKKVLCCDNNDELIKHVQQGVSPFSEPGLKEQLELVELEFTSDFKYIINETDITFIVLPTPSLDNGAFDYSIIESICTSLASAMMTKNGHHTLSLVSTVSPGTCCKLISTIENISGLKCEKDFSFCYNPSFIALGSVINNLTMPDFILLGGDKKGLDILGDFYTCFIKNHSPIHKMSIQSAEITKIALNAFITTKMTFANFLGRLCAKVEGADVDAITNALGSDSRIGAKYLHAALPFAGPCFPRDNKAFCHFASLSGLEAYISRAVDLLNKEQCYYIEEYVLKHVVKDSCVGILGVSYKPDTGVLDGSPAIKLVDRLKKESVNCRLYDPLVSKCGNYSDLIIDDIMSFLNVCDVLVLMHSSGKVVDDLNSAINSHNKQHVLIDCWRTQRFQGKKLRVISLFE